MKAQASGTQRGTPGMVVFTSRPNKAGALLARPRLESLRSDQSNRPAAWASMV